MIDKGLALLLAAAFPDTSVTWGAPRDNELENFICVHLGPGDNVHPALASIVTLTIVSQGIPLQSLIDTLALIANVVSDGTYIQWTRYEGSTSMPLSKTGGQPLAGYRTDVSVLCQ